jgi:hypothetical protein
VHHGAPGNRESVTGIGVEHHGQNEEGQWVREPLAGLLMEIRCSLGKQKRPERGIEEASFFNRS